MSRKKQTYRDKSRLVVAWVGGGIRHEASFRGSGNVLKSDCGDGCTVWNIY